ncbi:hypothetical protein CYFUS_001683 [Cystobacter fuscus]|uniref:IrrE N-terminal-like domain-containing protein n=1 Tax=Cystobacter fuscus TaxID=43 RepID=A0A250IX10_9BACT|nr:ImmA/IrrE family metallo-endopeptidase [Cystobacter fuscus]ATB36269.1 hypothetical protein CYFUS_001683 [Cystobacter fuscus]
MRSDLTAKTISLRKPQWRVMREKRASASQLLQAFGIHQPPVPIEDIVEWLGVHLNYVQNAGWSGAVKITPPNRADIWVANDESYVRRRFTLAHEIGHLMLHNAEEETYRDVSFAGSRKEVEANNYAASLLMPFRMLEAYVDEYGPRVSVLASAFEVSEAAMRIRLENMAGY